MGFFLAAAAKRRALVTGLREGAFSVAPTKSQASAIKVEVRDF